MSTLKVDGAELYYETVGEGPLLLLIAGAQGSAMIFQAVADELKDRFTVLTYDRRGFARSVLDGEQDYGRRLETDADDVARLIEHVGKGPAVVFGTSSGAIVALTVLSRHPDVVATLVAHEPPATRYLPDAADETLAKNDAIYAKYRDEGIPAAMKDFLATWMPVATSDQKLFAQAASAPPAPAMIKDRIYWFEHELRQYPSTRLDIDALRRHADRLLLTMGDEMHGNPTTPIVKELSKRTGAPVHEMPGGHVGYAVLPERFADSLAGMLADRV